MSSTYERWVLLVMMLVVGLMLAASVEVQRASRPSTVCDVCVWSQLRSMLPLLHAENGGQAPDLHSKPGSGVSRFSRSASRS